MKKQALFFSLLLLLSKSTFAEQNSFLENKQNKLPKTSQLTNRAFDLASRGDFTIAIARLKEAWSLNPSQTEIFLKSLSIIHNNYAKALIKSKEFLKAKENFRKAIFFDQSNLIASQNLDLLTGTTDFEKRLKEARSLRAEKKLEEAIAEYRAVLKNKNKNLKRELQEQVLIELGQVYYVYSLTLYQGLFLDQQLKNLAEVLSELKKLKEYQKSSKTQNKEDPRFYLLEGFYFRQKKELAKSVTSFQKAFDLAPKNRQVSLELIKTWKQIVELFPKEEQNWQGLRQIMKKVYQEKEQSKYFTAAAYKLLSFSDPDFKKALDFFEDALNLNSSDQAALDGLIQVWKEVIKKAPDHPHNWIGFSQSLAKKGLYREAKLASEKANELLEKDSLTYPLDSSLKQEIKLLLSQEKSLDLSKKAYQAQLKNQFPKAIDLYQKALENLVPSPEAAKIFYNLFLCYQKEKSEQKAWESLQKAYQYDSFSKRIKEAYQESEQTILELLLKAKSSLAQKDYYQAERLYKKALIFQKENPEVYFNLGLISEELAKYRKAETYYRKALKLSPKDKTYFQALNFLQSKLPDVNQKYNQKYNQKDSQENNQENKFSKLVRKGLEYQSKNKNLSLAIEEYQKALEIKPRSAVVNFNLGVIFHQLERFEEAITFYQRAYQYDPKNYPETNFFSGFLSEKLGEFQKSYRYYQLYLKEQPDGIYSQKIKKRLVLLDRLLN